MINKKCPNLYFRDFKSQIPFVESFLIADYKIPWNLYANNKCMDSLASSLMLVNIIFRILFC